VYSFFAAKTINRDYGEDLGSDEERSIESKDLRKNDVSDLFDVTEEARRPREPGQLENLRDLLANTVSVPLSSGTWTVSVDNEKIVEFLTTPKQGLFIDRSPRLVT
jgi:hypothetical protein